MKNWHILILKGALTIFLFSSGFNLCMGQVKTDRQMPASDTPAVKTDTGRQKLKLLNQAPWTYSTNSYRQKNPKFIAFNSDYLPRENICADTINHSGVKSTLTQPANISVPDLTPEKREGRFLGWIGYTTSRTENLFDSSNDFNWFPTVQDRIHDFSLVGTYRFTDRFTFSGNLIQSNGNLVYGSSGYVYNSYDSNNVRFDFSATIQGQPHQNFRNSWSLGIYNLNGYWNSSATGAGVVDNKILPKPVPSVSWNLKFH